MALLFLGLATYILVWAPAHEILEGPILERGKLGFLLVPAILLTLGVPGGGGTAASCPQACSARAA